MQFIPWQTIANWKCTACGCCCKLYSVVLNFPEWLQLIKIFGPETTVAGINNLYIKRTSDGSCTFLCRYGHTYLCGLQNMKPIACKLWPFKILSEPKYGQANLARFNYQGRQIFIYADPMCNGLQFGMPTWEFTSLILPEFIELALGTRNTQHKTTGKLSFTANSRIPVQYLAIESQPNYAYKLLLCSNINRSN